MNRQEMVERLGKGESPLELSIAKWQDRVNSKELDIGTTALESQTCALCETYPDMECTGCPVANDKHVECLGTPFYNWLHAKKPQWKRYWAKKELNYLISLRPQSNENKPITEAKTSE